MLGDVAEPADLVIEVLWTCGGLDRVEVWRRLGVREAWLWKKGKLSVFALRETAAEQLTRSELLPGLDLDLLLTFVDVRPMTRAVRDYQAALRG